MKSTGIVRRVDELGRIVIPMELRKVLEISTKDSLEIFMDGNKIILQKYEASCCTFCGEEDGTIHFKSKNVCPKCLKELSKQNT